MSDTPTDAVTAVAVTVAENPITSATVENNNASSLPSSDPETNTQPSGPNPGGEEDVLIEAAAAALDEALLASVDNNSNSNNNNNGDLGDVVIVDESGEGGGGTHDLEQFAESVDLALGGEEPEVVNGDINISTEGNSDDIAAQEENAAEEGGGGDDEVIIAASDLPLTDNLTGVVDGGGELLDVNMTEDLIEAPITPEFDYIAQAAEDRETLLNVRSALSAAQARSSDITTRLSALFTVRRGEASPNIQATIPALLAKDESRLYNAIVAFARSSETSSNEQFDFDSQATLLQQT